MSVIRNFSSLSTAAWDLLPPDTAKSYDLIIKELSKQIDLARFDAIINQFLVHRTDTDNPHNVILGDIGQDVINLIYATYVGLSENPLSKEDFMSTYYEGGLPFIEMIRRIVLNSYSYIDGVGPNLSGPPTYTDSGLPADPITLVPSIAYDHRFDQNALVPTGSASVNDPFYNSNTSGSIPYPSGTFLMNWVLPPTPYNQKPVFSLSNGTQSIVLERQTGSVLTFKLIATGGVQIVQPSIASKLNIYLSNPNIVPAYNGTFKAGLVQFGFNPVPAAEGLLSVDPLIFRSDEGKVGFAYTTENLRIFFSYGGILRTVSVFFQGMSGPWTTYQFGLPIYSNSNLIDSFKSASLYPVYMTGDQAAEILITM